MRIKLKILLNGLKRKWLTEWFNECVYGVNNPIGGHKISLNNRHPVNIHGLVSLKDNKNDMTLITGPLQVNQIH